MVLADQSNRHDTGRGDGDGRPKEPLQHEDAFGMVAKSAVAKVRRDRLRLVEPLVQRQVVFGDAAPFFRRREGVMLAMSHDLLLTIRGCKFRRR
jgi:hypothetical protein